MTFDSPSHFFYILLTFSRWQQFRFALQIKSMLMKNMILVFTLLVSIPSLSQAQGSFKVDPDKASLSWKGSSLFGFGGHEGTVKLKEGRLLKTGDKITGGVFIIDMTTITNTDGEYNQNLVEHLKNEDFFAVKEYPTAKLVMTKIKYHDRNNTPDSNKTYLRIDANLTIKGVTQPIQYEAEINVQYTHIAARLKLDRTRWKVDFGSKGLGANLKNEIISDAIEFKVVLPLN